MAPTVSLRILSVQHDRHGLAEVERVAERLDAAAERLREIDGVAAVLPLGTCNRVELVVDAPSVSGDELARALAVDGEGPDWLLYDDDQAQRHVFRVCAGLESLVVGEREIAGQVRRALGEVQDAGLSSGTLSLVVEEALRTSRRIGRETSLAAAGRSVVSVALDAVWGRVGDAPRVLLVGTGSFAGACVAAVRARGGNRIEVHSVSGRAADFAHRHGLAIAPDLRDALASADLVICCRGAGTATIGPGDLAPDATLSILDLALPRDVDPAVEELPGITLLDLAALQQSINPGWADDLVHAERLVDEGLAETRTRLHTKVLDPAVVGLREAILELVDDEVSRLPQGRPLEVADAAHALRRLATRLLHVPSSRARLAAASGRTTEYLSAMAELYGIGGEDFTESGARCPATGLGALSVGEDTGEGGKDNEEKAG